MVYRYLNEQFGLLALQQQKWKVGRLLELNDPLDCQPTLKRRDGSKLISVSEDPYFAHIYDQIGIICYSESINDPVVWSHYADSHRGMAFGFEFLFPQDQLFQVQYPDDDARAEVNYEELGGLDEEALFKVISHGFTRKAKSWAYECEYRQFIFLGRCEMIGPHYFRAVPLTDLKRIVLGVRSRITESDVSHATHWDTSWKVEITKAQIDPATYKIRA